MKRISTVVAMRTDVFGRDKVQEITWGWMQQYNEDCPHEALGYMPPIEYEKLKNIT